MGQRGCRRLARDTEGVTSMQSKPSPTAARTAAIRHNLGLAEQSGAVKSWYVQGAMPGRRWTIEFVAGGMTVTRSMGTANAELIAAELACGIAVAYPPVLPYRDR